MSWKEEYAKRFAYVLMVSADAPDALKPCRFVGSTLRVPKARRVDFDTHLDPLAVLCGMRPREIKDDSTSLGLREFRSGPMMIAVYTNLAPGEWLCRMVDEYLAPPRLVRVLGACARRMMDARLARKS